METRVFIFFALFIGVLLMYAEHALSDYANHKVYSTAYIEKNWKYSCFFFSELGLLSIVLLLIWEEFDYVWLLPVIVGLTFWIKKINYDYQRKIHDQIAPKFSRSLSVSFQPKEFIEATCVAGEVSFIGAKYKCFLKIEKKDYEKCFDAIQWRKTLQVKFMEDVFYPNGLNFVKLDNISNN